VDQKVLESIAKKLDQDYGTNEAPPIVHRGKVHEYLAMNINNPINRAIQLLMDGFI